MKKIISLATAIIMTVSSISISASALDYESAAAAAENAVINYNRSVPLKVKGNKIVEQGTDNMVVLRGANVPSLGWGQAEHIYESVVMLYDNWHANIVRLPIQPKYWFGRDDTAVLKDKDVYRKYIDDAVKAAQARGKYIILDCHTYVMPLEESLEMWLEVAEKYKNNSAVLFGLLNEPHDIKPSGGDAGRSAWDVWRNGGQITISDNEVRGVGHQELLEAIRGTGANNICIAGGLNWAFDISGLADGYDGLENGYRLVDTASGNGVMYDSHAYPVKGAKNAWDKTIGPVRRVAPVLIGEWGWDSSDNAISGGDCTADIWMNQLMSWMDDEYGEYGGIPVNWTGWNMHMSSTPKMLYSWDFKTTAYNGTHIKKRLQSYGMQPEKYDGVYYADFSENDEFRSYTAVSGKSSVTYSSENQNVVIYHQPTTWSAKLDFPYDWDLNGIQTITMDISCDIEETINIGLYGADEEAWTTPVQIGGEVKTVTIRTDRLEKQGNPLTDGILDGALSGIYFGSVATKKGNITVDNIKIVKLANPVYIPDEYPHQDTGTESYYDIDNKDFVSQRLDQGPGSSKGDYFKTENETVKDFQENDTAAKHISYNRINGVWGGSVQYNLETVPSKDTKYFTVCLRSSGTAQTIGVSVGDLGTFSVSFEEGDTNWHQYIYCLDGNIEYPEDIKYVKFSASKKIEADFYADNFGFSKEKPERIVPNPEKTFIYDFATYNKNTGKYEAKFSTAAGSEGDTISSVKADGGFDEDSKALQINYSREGGVPSKVLMVYSSSDFFKGNANDDERTANRKTLKADMEYMTNLIFYGKSTSGKDEKVNIGVIDAANAMSAYTDTKEVIFTDEWKQFKIPFDEFNVLDGGKPLDCSRVRGFVFSSAESSGEVGSFVIDNITHTSLENIDWSEPAPPTENPATPSPSVSPSPDTSPTPQPPTEAKPPVCGENVTVVTTAEEFMALTASDTTVQLGADIDLGSTGVKTKCPTYLDLNGHTLTSSASAVIELTQHFTLVDTSPDKTGALINTNTNTSYGIKCAGKNLAVSIDGARVDAGAQAILLNGAGSYINIKDAVINGGTYAINVGENGTLNIESAVINPDENYKGYSFYTSGGSVTIEDGIFNYNGNVSSAGISGASNVVINGGVFTNPNRGRGAINNVKGFTGTITINGGTFENTGGGYSILDGDEAAASAPVINISGGNFKSGIGATKPNNTTTLIAVTGGTFSFDPVAYVDTETYDIIVNSDNTFTVTGAEGPSPAPENIYIYDITQCDNDIITVEVEIPEKTSEGDTMYVASYVGDRLCEVYIVTDIKEQNTFAAYEGAEKVRVFIWNKNMESISEKKQK